MARKPSSWSRTSLSGFVKRVAAALSGELMALANEAAAREHARELVAGGAQASTRIFKTLVTSIEAGARPRLGDAVKRFENHYIAAVLAENNGNISEAARVLRVPRQALQRKLRRLGHAPRRRG